MQRRANIWNNIDWTTVFIYLLLVLLGWINIYAAVYNEDHQSIFDFSQRYGKQMIWIFAAFLLILVVFTIDIRYYTFFAYFIYGVMIFILLAVLIFGKEVHGAKSWFEIGNIRIQPSEFAKIATALALARYLSSFNVQINSFKSYLRIGLILFLPAFLILLQNDTGSALVYFAFALVLFREGLSGSVFLLGILIVILFILALVLEKITLIAIAVIVALIVFWILTRKFKQFAMAVLIFVFSSAMFWGIDYFLGLKILKYYIILLAIALSSIIYVYLAFKHKIKHVFILILFLFGSIMFAFSVDYVFHQILEHHQQKRINTLLGLESDPLGIGYNVNQSKIAIGSGGFSGKGFLRGTQTKFDFVPEQSTDFIFCTIGEEWGFMGTFFVTSLFIALLLRLVYIAERQKSSFSRMYGYGVVAVLFFHIIINIGMTIGLMPVIGIPLPFFSYGGSSLWAFTILLFILLRLDANRLETVK
ncbi:MAG: rod shape-determining protein RodA [Bacteroidetes bacterium GWC2_33_15]|nr:MAG: rod shape-determining protein RodA [Bacteroidetes bacterium GWA2_33_15]OFX51891.1 MAG: rod shape-determining protein RodA [Bacteroidetes bacterium GWC2_33_15]OFX63459.1 MAG: rod shape-determining protein RodA [Bacteroidetes bacterium GWB2_32_14]OFX67192.1 MAG: rod shape-determining protein RodA [Bacteroidetes bacterium GWD2_33_33]HAN17083.1 rod shape-determining protein RodA [Bacteroidales bacterium]